MLFVRKKKIQYYNSCEDFPYYNFYKVIETKNYAYLVLGWDERDEVKFDEEFAGRRWKKIYAEYNKLKDDNKLIAYIDICTEIVYLENKKYVVSCLLSVLAQDEDNKDRFQLFADEIGKWGLKMNTENPVLDECLKIQKHLSGLENKIRLLYFEKDGFYSDNEEEISLYKQVVRIEQALKRNEVDPKKISVSKWVYMIEEIKEIIEQRKKAS